MSGAAPAAPLSREELRERTFDGVRWFSLTRGLAETTQIAAAVVLARLVSPEQFGRLAVAIIVNEFANCIAAETIGTPLIQRSEVRRAHLEAAAFLGLIIGGGLGLITLFLIPLVTTPVFGAPTSSLFQLFAPAFALTGLQIVPLAQLNRDLRFRHIGVVEVVGVLAASMVSVGLAIVGLGARSYVVGVLVGLVICTVGYMTGSGVVMPRWRPRETAELLRFGLPASAAGLAGVTYRNIDYMVLGIRLPAVTVGYYYRAFTLGVEYERRLSGIIARLAFPVYARASDAVHRRELRARIARANATAIYPLLTLFIVIAPAVVPWLFGQRWEPAVLPAQILAVAGMASTLRSLTGPSVLAAGRPRALLVFSVCEAVFYGLTVWLAATHGLTAICCAVAGFQIISVLVAYTVLLTRAVGLPISQLPRDVGPALISCIPLAVLASVLRSALGHHVPVLGMVAIVTPLALTAYLLTMRALFASAWLDVTLLAGRIAPTRLARGRRAGAVSTPGTAMPSQILEP
jgi:lipopolysaccharide exporter